MLKGNISPSLSTVCFHVNNYLRKQACNLLQEANFKKLDLNMDLSCAWKIIKRTHKASNSMAGFSKKQQDFKTASEKMNSYPPYPTFPREIKAEVLKGARQKHCVCSALSPGCWKVISDWEVLSSSLHFSLEHSRFTDESSADTWS